MAENNRLHETLSACMDGEARELELRQLLRDMAEDDELRLRWRRYNLARSAMTRELPPLRVDVADGVRQALEGEAIYKPSAVGKVFQSASRFAIAASVAAIAVVGVRSYQFGADPLEQTTPSQAAPLQAEATNPLQPAVNFDIPIAARTVGAGGTPLTSSPYAVNGPQVLRPIQPDPATSQEIQVYFDELMTLHAESASYSVNPAMLNLMRMPQQAPRPNR